MLKGYIATILFLYSFVVFPQDFVTTWKTDNIGATGNNQISIPTHTSSTYDYTVDWGDGSSDTNVTGDITHTYAIPGTYTVTISGLFPRIYFEDLLNTKDPMKLLTVEQWGSNPWQSMFGAFSGCGNMDVVATDVPDLSLVTDLARMFQGCTLLVGNNSFTTWDMTTVLYMGEMFEDATMFNQPIGSWDVSGVETMNSLFRGALAFDQDISGWDTGNIMWMSQMFMGTSFNPDISGWDTSSLTDMSFMFEMNDTFNRDISSWDTSNVRWMSRAFLGATAFNQDISSWDVGSAEFMSEVFSGASSFNQDLSTWNIAKASNMTSIFDDSGLSDENYNNILIGWSNLPTLQEDVKFGASGNQFCEGGPARQNLIVTYNWEINDGGISAGCTVDQQRAFVTTWQISDASNPAVIPTHPSESYSYTVDWGDGNVDSDVTGNASHTYSQTGTYDIAITGTFPRIHFNSGTVNAALIENVIQWGDMEWTSMEGAFSNCVNLDVTAKDTPNLSLATSANSMFSNCSSLVGNTSLNKWDVSGLVDVGEMFSGATQFNQILSNWNTSSVTNMFRMFYQSGFQNSLGTWDVSNVGNLTEVLTGSQLTTVNFDNTLVAWSQLGSLQNNLQFDTGSSEYCLGATARQSIIDSYGWTINDNGENCPTQNAFVTTWKTDNEGMSEDNALSIPIVGGPYTIDWGDGTVEIDLFGTATHTYTTVGTYTVSIVADAVSIQHNSYPGNEAFSDATKLLEINQWGDIQWNSMLAAFAGCSNMDVVAYDVPDFSGLTSLFGMFSYCGSLKGNATFNAWDISNIDNLTQVFYVCSQFNADISNWDVSNVTAISNLFVNCSIFNQDISNWDVSSVTDMGGMFSGAIQFNQDISGWNVSNVTSMRSMFQHSEFNQDISGWDVSNVTDMTAMFNQTPNFNQDISGWDVSSVTDMSSMFGGTGAFNQDISGWDVSNVTRMWATFSNSTVFNQDISGWDVSNVTNMFWLFARATAFNQDLGNWDVSKVTDMTDIFESGNMSNYNYDRTLIGWAGLPSLQFGVTFDAPQNQYCASEEARQNIIDTYNWIINDGGELSNCGSPFVTTWKTDNPGLSEDNQITIPTFPGETYDYTVDWGDGSTDSNVTGDITHTYATPGTYTVSITGVFPRIYFNDFTLNFSDFTGDELKLLTIEQWGNIHWTSMEAAFAGCWNLQFNATDIPDLTSVSSTRNMFYNCLFFAGNESFADWDVSVVTDMAYMFDKTTFDQDISAWDVSNVEYMSYMFYSSRFNHDINGWDVSNVRWMEGMFSSGQFNQDLSNWDVSKVMSMEHMFSSTYFNQDISSWDVSSVTNMTYMFTQGHFDQDISGWDVSNVSAMDFMFDASDLSDENYDNILLGWSQLASLQNGVNLGANEAYYCDSEAARALLINTYGWTINDLGINCEAPIPFITTWKTDNPGPSEDNQITIPTHPLENYDYTVDWGDGSTDEGVTGDFTHTYASPGTYQVTISGKFPGVFFNGSPNGHSIAPTDSDDQKILSVDQWGNNRWFTTTYAFAGCSNLDVLATDEPDFSRSGLNTSGMFRDCASLVGNDSFNAWEVANVTVMGYMFSEASLFDQDLGSWDVSNVLDMASMFDGSGLSTANYDKTLKGWSALPSLANGIWLGANNTQYCTSETERQLIIDTYGWNINDGGKAPDGCELVGAFVTTWKTDNPGVSNNNQITIPTTGGGYNYDVDWGDGNVDLGVTGDITHTYDVPGTYDVAIKGDFPQIYFVNQGDREKILSVKQWGHISWRSMLNAFHGCSNLDVEATDIPDLSNVTTTQYMFRLCGSLVGNGTFNGWDTSTVTSMDFMFREATQFNQDISGWDTGQVNSMIGMFLDAKAFDQNIGSWDVQNVSSLDRTFSGAEVFNQDLANWNVSNVSNMWSMFANALAFNQNLGDWDVSNVSNMTSIFDGAGMSTSNYDQTLMGWSALPSLTNGVVLGANNAQYCASESERQQIIDTYGWTINDGGKAVIGCQVEDAFITTWKTDNPGFSDDNQVSISTSAPAGGTYNYNVDWGDGTADSGVTGNIVHTYSTPGVYQIVISGEFPRINFNGNNADNEKILQINQWGSIQWTSMAAAFAGCSNLDVVADDVPDLSNVSSTARMFSGCTSLVGNGAFQNWPMGTITITDSMFALAEQFNADISNWDVSNVTSMFAMFNGATSFNQNIGSWNVANVTNLGGMFANSGFNQDISAWDVGNVTDLGGMFSSNTVFNQDISTWDVGTVTDMSSMFHNAESFNQDVSAWDVSNVTDMTNMFNTAISFNANIGNWDVGNVQVMVGMFQSATAFDQDLGLWDVGNLSSTMWMFAGATSFDQSLAGWNVQNVSNMGLMFDMTGLSSENYDSTLKAWAQLPSLQIGVSFDAGSSLYCTGEDARQALIDNFGWTISDGGKIPLCNEDNDGDGILDQVDSCLDTRPGANVGPDGCEMIPNNAIKVYALTPSCIGSQDGAIEIAVETTGLEMDIVLEGSGAPAQYNDVSTSAPFNITDLAAGNYTLTISIPEIVFEQQYGITINEVDNITGKRTSLENKTNAVVYEVSGSTAYEVVVNGKARFFNFIDTYSQTIRLDNLDTYNEITIKGSSDCQGKVADTFFMGETILVYPTITSDKINLIGDYDHLTVGVFSMAGQLVKHDEVNGATGFTKTMDVSALESGMYMVRIVADNKEKTVKIVKK
ncbi:BspA family leucine-rich repeat surface protein [Flagellimonas myxillae]|uniref:BspA family leucine-rich repeat surface protein n=1 Tax=Flagellimonas myxillae TaxID=2942214 RepID=UPI00201E890D|nr:BspA family leucine-rich repeat surface protein [Muricauda myxillae]MCL6267059.1 BspA family leucine-rich repeat surface protein [Muricauda myxillae]